MNGECMFVSVTRSNGTTYHVAIAHILAIHDREEGGSYILFNANEKSGKYGIEVAEVSETVLDRIEGSIVTFQLLLKSATA